MMRKAFILGGLALACAAGPAHAASIVNGSFESATVNPGGGFVTLGTGSTAITGWTVTGGSIDYIGGYWQAQDGQRSVDLAGSSLGTLAQTFSTIANVTYEVTFWISKNPDGGAVVRTGTISAGANSGLFTYSASNSRANMNWVQDTFRFTATGSSTTLSFAANADAGCCFGPALDNVGIAVVPEPASWALFILGFGAIGAALRRKAVRSTGLRFA